MKSIKEQVSKNISSAIFKAIEMVDIGKKLRNSVLKKLQSMSSN